MGMIAVSAEQDPQRTHKWCFLACNTPMALQGNHKSRQKNKMPGSCGPTPLNSELAEFLLPSSIHQLNVKKKSPENLPADHTPRFCSSFCSCIEILETPSKLLEKAGQVLSIAVQAVPETGREFCTSLKS